MKGNRNKTWPQAVGAFALGATTATAATLLLAPASGRATRRKLVSKFRSMERSANRQILQSKKLLARKAGLLKDAAVEKIGGTREWLLERMPNGNGARHHPMPRHATHR